MSKRIVSTDNAGKNIWQKLNKSRISRQEENTLLYLFPGILAINVENSFLALGCVLPRPRVLDFFNTS